MSFSAPSAINLDHSVVKFDTEVEKFHIARRQSEAQDDATSQDSLPVHADSTTHDWQSLSCLTDSTEQSVPINFDMSNRVSLVRSTHCQTLILDQRVFQYSGRFGYI